jgi:hypothetical protein
MRVVNATNTAIMIGFGILWRWHDALTDILRNLIKQISFSPGKSFLAYSSWLAIAI